MGCAESKARAAGDGFVNGRPSASFPHDEIRKCTERGNGLLFRLVNSDAKQWAFYNDSKTYEFHITVFFSTHSQVKALGDTILLTDPSDGRTVARAVAYPCQTTPFVQGDIDGFDAEYQAVMLTEEYTRKKKKTRKANKNRSSNNKNNATT